MFDTWCRWIFYPFLHRIVVYRHFSYFQYGFQNGRQRSRDYFTIIGSNESLYILLKIIKGPILSIITVLYFV